MDTSEKYIKMCEKAEEIQGNNHIWMAGDWHIIGGSYNRGKPQILGGSLYTIIQNNFYNWDRESIWLPRQDQLQEMIKKTTDYNLYIDFRMWSVTSAYSYEEIISFSMEQLWLAFVMQEKFQKIWSKTEEKWISIK